jgi:alternate signal-mediated exported protein
MKNATKAVIAGVAGLALLTGGAGSLAYWNDTKAGSSVTIQSGTLSLGTIADGSWTLQQNSSDLPNGTTASGTTPYVGGTTLIVPGDTLTQTVSVPVTITGTDNKARITVSGATSGTGTALAAVLTPTISVAGGGTTALVTTSGNVSVKVTITFPWGTAVDNTTKLQTTAYQLTYTVQQIPFTATS